MAIIGGSSLFLWGALSPPASGVLQGPPRPPKPLGGLTPAEQRLFQAGVGVFAELEAPPDGLGPVFNGVSCAECHRAGGLGGAAENLGVARVTRIGGMTNGKYTDLAQVGGPLLQSRSLRELIRGYPVPGEVVPKEAQFVSHRITTPLFGAGLIEAIPDSAILALERQSQPDGVHGVANRVLNPDTGKTEIGRFGWKAQVSALHWFSGDAYLNEMGITSPVFSHENLPQGKPIPKGADQVPDPEEAGPDIAAATDFMRFLAPLDPVPPTPEAIRGEAIFANVRCTSCHVPTLQTGANLSKALSNIPVRLFSDLLLHRMGAGLADGIQQGQAAGDQFRTAPLWGVGRRPFLLHDGRANSVDQAIRLHAGEALSSHDRYLRLNPRDRNAVIEFLNGL
ncbi:di-heme oxidoredictase family protein [Fimbriimonas ginsengisoli]|uniref:di-heme oxidoredictase family protein n=1 Tax=Fimbriimonas ginsengisoli TaxID=1005039 RepID=UPI0003E93CB6|nr:di-heme oxidoredictase family protein [Fimbriimonas ginsengisoli]